MKLELEDEEARVLVEALDSYLGDLSSEIADTDAMDFREALKKRRDVLVRIATMLRDTT